MNKKADAEKASALLSKLAASVPNDAVKLLFLDDEDLSVLESLDLFLLSEIKRSPSGAVELKFVDRLAVIRELMELKKTENAAVEDSFYAALDRSAMLLKDEPKDK